MPSDRPDLSKGEVEIAQCVWELKQASVREVYERLNAKRSIEFSTVQTYLRRLADKGYLHVAKRGRSLVYSSRVRSGTVVREVIDDVINRWFSGQTMPLFRHLIEARGISDEEIDELRQLLNRLEEDE